MPNAPVPAAATGLPDISRRTFFGQASGVTATATLSGFAVTSPAAAAICRAAPFVPSMDPPPLAAAAAGSDAGLLELCEKFRRLTASSAEIWARYSVLPEGTTEAKALGAALEAECCDWAETADACYAIQPRTLRGAVALLAVILTNDADHIEPVVLGPLQMVHGALASMVRS